MAKKNNKFLLVSLQDNEAKKLAQVIANKTCKQILDYLGEKEHATESQISKDLNLPISTVHYNIQQLMEGKLIESEEFHYSAKGKEVNHYTLANKYIIIAPKSTYGLKEKLKSILPVVGIAGGIALIMQFFKPAVTFSAAKTAELADLAPAAAELAIDESADIASKGLETISAVAQPSFWTNIPIWFFIGAVAAVILLLGIDWFRKKE